jgi:hypothetical protein
MSIQFVRACDQFLSRVLDPGLHREAIWDLPDLATAMNREFREAFPVASLDGPLVTFEIESSKRISPRIRGKKPDRQERKDRIIVSYRQEYLGITDEIAEKIIDASWLGGESSVEFQRFLTLNVAMAIRFWRNKAVAVGVTNERPALDLPVTVPSGNTSKGTRFLDAYNRLALRLSTPEMMFQSVRELPGLAEKLNQAFMADFPEKAKNQPLVGMTFEELHPDDSEYRQPFLQGFLFSSCRTDPNGFDDRGIFYKHFYTVEFVPRFNAQIGFEGVFPELPLSLRCWAEWAAEQCAVSRDIRTFHKDKIDAFILEKNPKPAELQDFIEHITGDRPSYGAAKTRLSRSRKPARKS